MLAPEQRSGCLPPSGGGVSAPAPLRGSRSSDGKAPRGEREEASPCGPGREGVSESDLPPLSKRPTAPGLLSLAPLQRGGGGGRGEPARWN